MTLRIERDALVETVSVASRVVESNAGMASARGLHITAQGGRTVVTGTDLETTVQAVADGDGDLDDMVVPAKLFADVVRSLEPGSVNIGPDDATGTRVRVSSGRAAFTLATYSVGDVIVTSQVDGEDVVVDGGDLVAALAQVVPCASSDPQRPILGGILLEGTETGLRLVGTDSYRLAVRDLPGITAVPAGTSVLVPRKPLAELARLLGADSKVRIRLDPAESRRRAVSLSTGRVRITSVLVGGDYPAYRNLLPATAGASRLTVEVRPFLDALKRMSPLAVAEIPVRFSLGGDNLLGMDVVNTSLGTGHEELDGTYEGPPLKIAFNRGYLAFGLEACGAEHVVVEMSDGLRPALVRPRDDDGSFRYLLMPVRVS